MLGSIGISDLMKESKSLDEQSFRRSARHSFEFCLWNEMSENETSGNVSIYLYTMVCLIHLYYH